MSSISMYMQYYTAFLLVVEPTLTSIVTKLSQLSPWIDDYFHCTKTALLLNAILDDLQLHVTDS